MRAVGAGVPRTGSRGVRLVLAAACVLLGAPHAAAQRAAGPDPAEEARVECAAAADAASCAADAATYVGWRVFEAECAVCHARGGTGSSFAPALAPRISRMDWPAFVDVLEEGYRGVGDALPPHGERPNVARYYAELWRYLTARADGRLPAGPVEPLDGARE